MRTIDEVIDLACDFWRINRSAMTGRVRTVQAYIPRASAMIAARAIGYTYQEIGKVFERDHGTIINAVQNNNMQFFGRFWPHHQNFVKLATAETEDVVIKSAEQNLRHIEEVVRRLEEARNKLLGIASEQPTIAGVT